MICTRCCLGTLYCKFGCVVADLYYLRYNFWRSLLQYTVEITKPTTQVVINCSVLPSLITILATPHENLRKEACWAISNITAGNRVQIQVYVLYRLSECNVLDPDNEDHRQHLMALLARV